MGRRQLVSVLALFLWGMALPAGAASPARVDAIRLVLLPQEQGWYVIQMVEFSNPGHEAVALEVRLPGAASSVQLVQGFDPRTAAPAGDRVVDGARLAPGGQRQLVLLYLLPGAGRLDTALPVPAAGALVEVVVPSGVSLGAPGLAVAGSTSLGRREFTRYAVTAAPPDGTLPMRAVALPQPDPAPAMAPAAGSMPAESPDLLLLAVNAGIIVLILALASLGSDAPRGREHRPA